MQQKSLGFQLSKKNLAYFAKKFTFAEILTMYWTLELASKLEDAPWPANKDELIDLPFALVHQWKL